MAKNDSANNHGEAPVGMIVRYDFAAPTNWLACDGSTLTTTDYPELFAIIGYEYGGSGTDFDLPTVTDNIIRSF